jgi:hypothetical protein
VFLELTSHGACSDDSRKVNPGAEAHRGATCRNGALLVLLNIALVPPRGYVAMPTQHGETRVHGYKWGTSLAPG